MDPMILDTGGFGVTALAKSRKKPNAGGESSFGAEGGAPHGIDAGTTGHVRAGDCGNWPLRRRRAVRGALDTMGLPVQARYLRFARARAAGGQQTVEARRKVVRQALTQDDPAKIEGLPRLPRSAWALPTIVAEKLREVATGLGTRRRSPLPKARRVRSPVWLRRATCRTRTSRPCRDILTWPRTTR